MLVCLACLQNFDEFAEWMSTQLSEPGHSMQDVINAFKELAEDEPFIKEETVTTHFHDEGDRTYLFENMPLGEGDDTRDYEAFTAALFSR